MSDPRDRDLPFNGGNGAPRPVQEILVTSAQENEIFERLTCLSREHTRLMQEKARVIREINDVAETYNRERELARRIGVVDLFKHPSKLEMA